MTHVNEQMFNSLLDNRTIMLTGEINDVSAEVVTMALLYLDAQAVAPIHLYINSCGGSVYAMNSIVDTMNLIKSPVYTYNIGLAASAAGIILLNGEKGHRYATPNATTMLHQPIGGAEGSSMDVEIAVEQLKFIREKMFEFCSERTGKSVKQIKADLQRDKYFTAEQALKYGIIDVILKTDKGGK